MTDQEYILMKAWVIRRTGCFIVKSHADAIREFALPYRHVRNIHPLNGENTVPGWYTFECATWLMRKECLQEFARAALELAERGTTAEATS